MAVTSHSAIPPGGAQENGYDFSAHKDWLSALSAIGGTKGVADIFINSRGRVRIRAGRKYRAPKMDSALNGPESWRQLCELIHPEEPELKAGEFCREGGRHIGDHRYRVSRVREMNGEEFTLRVLPAKIPAPADILLPEDLVKRFLSFTDGLFIFSGSTGSGKSTSIASLIGENTRQPDGVRVVTVEDPIEYQHEDQSNASTFTYREVGAHTKSFATALREAVRMNPDLIVIGEMRDSESAQIAVEAALTGHKVVSTTHGGTVEQAMQRLGDLMGDIEGGIGGLAQAFRICVAQRLPLTTGPQPKVVPIHEILTATDAVVSKIRRKAFFSLRQDMESGSGDGMQTFAQAVAIRRNAGLMIR